MSTPHPHFFAATLVAFFFCFQSVSQCVIEVPITKDAQIVDTQPDNNGGTNPNIFAKRSPNGNLDPIQRSFFDIDVSCLPQGMQIDSARLFLYHELTTAGNSHENLNPCVLRRITSSWTETGITWNTQPSVTSANEVLVPVQSPGADLSILITDLVQDIVNEAPANRHGINFRLQSETGWQRQTYASSDHPTSSSHPKVVIYTSAQTATITSSTVAAQDTISAGDSTMVTFEICNSSTCCSITDETLTLSLPTGFSVINPSVIVGGNSMASFTGTTLQINQLGANECLTANVTLSTSSSTAAGAFPVCLQANGGFTLSGNNCTDVVVIAETDTTIGISDLENSEQISVYPNPSSGVVTIAFAANVFTYVRVNDLTGRTIASSSIPHGKTKLELNLSEQQAGVYLVVVKGEKHTSMQRAVLR